MRVVKEVPFLRRTDASEDKSVPADEAQKEQALDPADSEREDVGRIDMVLVREDDPSKWCALEIQAVYFSGDEMGPEFKNILEYTGQGIPRPLKFSSPIFLGPFGASYPVFESSQFSTANILAGF